MSHFQLPRSRYVATVPAPFFQVYPTDHVPQAMGENEVVATGTVPEDVWQVGGVYPFPSAAGVVSLVSDSGEDAVGGTGASTVWVVGLDADWKIIYEEVTMTGITPALTTLEFLRVNIIYGGDVGSNEVNVGNITGQIAATTVCYIQAEFGAELRAVWSVPEGLTLEIPQIISSVTESTGNSHAEVVLQVRPFGQSWQTGFMTSVVNRQNGANFPFVTPVYAPPKSDVRLRVLSVSATMHIDGGFAGIMYNEI